MAGYFSVHKKSAKRLKSSNIPPVIIFHHIIYRQLFRFLRVMLRYAAPF